MGRILKSDEDCADCLCRVCARNSYNDSYNPLAEDEKMPCICECKFGDELIETDEDCADYLPDVEQGISEDPNKMDKREVIRRIDAGWERETAAIYAAVKRISIAAIKKQIREKPVRVNECPACRTHMMIKHNFCPTCGQALDWQQEG